MKSKEAIESAIKQMERKVEEIQSQLDAGLVGEKEEYINLIDRYRWEGRISDLKWVLNENPDPQGN